MWADRRIENAFAAIPREHFLGPGSVISAEG
jgi:hypothetical protein